MLQAPGFKHLESSATPYRTRTSSVEPTGEQRCVIDGIAGYINDGAPEVLLAGRAGTGKTSLIPYLVSMFDRPAVVAPTGRAASILRSKGLGDARTIHSFLYQSPILDDDDEIIGWKDRDTPPDADGVIIDEVSMVGVKERDDLRGIDAQLIFVGDSGQLQPVKGPAWFHDGADFRLNTIHRQAAGSPIIQTAHHALETGEVVPSSDGAVRVVQGSKAEIDVVLDADVVLCFKNYTRKQLTRDIRELLGRSGPPQPGEPVMALSNCYQANLFNGEIRQLGEWNVDRPYGAVGVSDKSCWPIIGGLRLPINAAEIDQIIGDESVVPNINLNQKLGVWRNHPYADPKPIWPIGLTFGYVATVHKSQGSEWDHVAIVDDCPRGSSMRRSWLYTAITRAKRTVTIIDVTK